MDLLLLNCYLSILQTYLNSSYDSEAKCSVLSVQEFNKMKVSKIIFLHFFQFKNFRDYVASVSLRIHVLKEVQLIVTNDHLAYFNIKFSILKHNIKNYVIKSFKAIAADKITVLYETSASVKKTLPC